MKKALLLFSVLAVSGILLLGFGGCQAVFSNEQPPEEIAAPSQALPQALCFSPLTALADGNGYEPKTVNVYASVSPATASNKAVDWSVSFADGTNEWADGKTASDYITVTPESDGALTADITCLQPFGAQIAVTVTSRYNPEITATCTVDYVQSPDPTSAIYSGMILYSQKDVILRVSLAETAEVNMLHLLDPADVQVWMNEGTHIGVPMITFSSETYTLKNSVTSSLFEIKASDEFLSYYDSPATDWVTLGSGVSMYGIVSSLTAATNFKPNDYADIYNALLNAFAQTESTDFIIRITFNLKYGDPYVAEFPCHVSHDSPGLAVEGVTLDETLVF